MRKPTKSAIAEAFEKARLQDEENRRLYKQICDELRPYVRPLTSGP